LDFGQEEEDDGHGNVHGYYHVQLPDGRHQRVDYHVDGYSGFIADVKYDGKASHPVHHSSGHHGGRFGKSLDLSKQPGAPHIKTSSHFGRQEKSLNFAEDLRNSESQLEHKLQPSFGESDRKGKALTFKSKTIDISKQEKNPSIRPVDTFHNAGHFAGFGRQGKSLNSDSDRRFGFESNSDSFGSSFGSSQSSLRKRKTDENVKNKKKKSNLITRRRIERAGVLESTSSKKNESVVLDTSVVEKKEQLKKKPIFSQKKEYPKVQNTFFQYVPKNIKSPFPSNFYEELQLKSEEKKQVTEKKDREEKILDKPASTEEIHQLETEQQEEFLTGIYEEKQPIKEENEIESGENRLPAIRGKVLYGP